MSNTSKDGGPAFAMGVPEGFHRTHPAYSQRGLSKREYFAAMAMQAILSNAEAYSVPANLVGEFAVGHADKLLEALSKEVEP